MLRKLLSFWLGPLLVGCSLAIGYESTPRILLLIAQSRKGPNGISHRQEAFIHTKKMPAEIKQRLLRETAKPKPKSFIAEDQPLSIENDSLSKLNERKNTQENSKKNEAKLIKKDLLSESDKSNENDLKAAIKSLKPISKLNESKEVKPKKDFLGLSIKDSSSLDGKISYRKEMFIELFEKLPRL